MTKRHPLTPEEAVALIAEHGGLMAASRATGLSHGLLQRRRNEVAAPTIRLPISDEVFREIDEGDDLDPSRKIRDPGWMVDQSPPKAGPGTPVLFVSDVHAGETVDPREMGGLNAYNWDLMERRLCKVFRKAAELPTVHLANEGYPGIVVVLGGDMVSGDIHDELVRTNNMTTLETTYHLSSLLAGNLKRLADVYGRVHCVGVAGNHGRMQKKVEAKGFGRNSADRHTYLQTQRLLEGDTRFTFDFPVTPDVRFDVAGRRFLLTHGDQFRGGDGMVGAMGPIMRGLHKKHSVASRRGEPFDTMLLGHWHQVIFTPWVIVNGSLKGWDEFAQRGNFQPEPPAQMLFTVHPEYGINWAMPLLAKDM